MATKSKSGKKRMPGRLTTAARNRLTARRFAFPKERKEPLSDAKHVRNAIARFDQVKGVSDRERDVAWKRIKKAAKKFHIEVTETHWRELGVNKKSKSGTSKSNSHK